MNLLQMNLFQSFIATQKGSLSTTRIAYEVEPFMGPLIDQQSVDNYLNYMGMAKREGIEEIMRGRK